MISKTIGKAIKVERERRGLSLAQMAEQVGESKSQLHRIEAGKGFSVEHISWIRHILGIDLNKIVDNYGGDYHGPADISDFI